MGDENDVACGKQVGFQQADMRWWKTLQAQRLAEARERGQGVQCVYHRAGRIVGNRAGEEVCLDVKQLSTSYFVLDTMCHIENKNMKKT